MLEKLNIHGNIKILVIYQFFLNISRSNFTDPHLIVLKLLAVKQTDCVSHHRDPKRDRACSDMMKKKQQFKDKKKQFKRLQIYFTIRQLTKTSH